jgi:hypothetical protein
VNGTDSEVLSVTLSGAGVYASNASGDVAIAAGDKLAYTSIPTGTPSTNMMTMALLAQVGGAAALKQMGGMV